MNHPHPLAGQWRDRADQIRDAAPETAHFYLALADELDSWEREHWLEELTIAEAAKESGYSKDTLYRQVESGRLFNRGSKGNPAVRRGDLGRKARSSP